jgi:hypothetical protein
LFPVETFQYQPFAALSWYHPLSLYGYSVPQLWNRLGLTDHSTPLTTEIIADPGLVHDAALLSSPALVPHPALIPRTATISQPAIVHQPVLSPWYNYQPIALVRHSGPFQWNRFNKAPLESKVDEVQAPIQKEAPTDESTLLQSPALLPQPALVPSTTLIHQPALVPGTTLIHQPALVPSTAVIHQPALVPSTALVHQPAFYNPPVLSPLYHPLPVNSPSTPYLLNRLSLGIRSTPLNTEIVHQPTVLQDPALLHGPALLPDPGLLHHSTVYQHPLGIFNSLGDRLVHGMMKHFVLF